MNIKYICISIMSSSYSIVLWLLLSSVFFVPWIWFLSQASYFFKHTQTQRESSSFTWKISKHIGRDWEYFFIWWICLQLVGGGGGIWDFPPYSQTSRSVHILSYLYLSTLLSIYLSHMYLSIKLSLAFTITDFSSVL